MTGVDFFIKEYKLEIHPEGGYYKQTYRSDLVLSKDSLPAKFGGDRLSSTAIYFLLGKGNFSAFHRIKSDECWHFYAGQCLHIYIIDPNGILTTIRLGNQSQKGELFQFVVPAGYWFASEPAPSTDYSFVGCTVSPGFDFEDFELAGAANLSSKFPQHMDLIQRLCRQ